MLLLAMVLSATEAFAQTVGTVFEYGGCEYRVSKKDVDPNPALSKYEVLVLTVKGSGKVTIPIKVQSPEGMDREWYNVVGCVAWESKVQDGVTEVEFSEGFKEISNNSFRKPQTLQKVIIPKSCEKVGIGCFVDCPKLTSFEVKSGNMNYKTASDGSLLSYNGKQLVYVPAGKAGEYSVPNNVEEIMPSAFSNCKKMTKITIPASVTKISENGEYPSFNTSGTHFTVLGGNNFCDKDGLLCDKEGKKLLHVPFKYDKLEQPTEKLKIPDGITEVSQNAAIGSSIKQLDLNQTKIIGNNAFNSCSALESVTIGKDVNKIGQGAFTNCQFIETFVVDKQNSNYVAKDGVIFTKDGKNLLLYPCGKKNDYTVPEGTIKIEDFAFSDVQNLENVTIAKTVKTICPSAFKGAKILKKVDFQGTTNLETIGDHAFQNTKLENITIPASVKNLEGAGFADIETLKEVHFADGCQLKELSGNLFQNAKNLKTVSFDGTNSLEKISSYVFFNCPKLETFKIPKTVSEIASGAFKGTKGLKTVEFEKGSVLTRIGNGAFADCGITHITLPESIKLIESFAFDHCSNLTEIKLPKNLQEVQKGAFNFCENLLRFIVDKGNTKYSTLDGMLCDFDKKVLQVFPAGKANSKYTLVPYFEKVAQFCFYGSNKVTNITFPRTVKEIESRAIALCNKLESLSFMGEDNVPTLNADIMYESGNKKNVTIYVRKKWYETGTNDETIKKYNQTFKEVHPSFVSSKGYDRGTEFFPTSMKNVGAISFYTERTSVILDKTAKEDAVTTPDRFGKTFPEKTYDVSSILDFAYEKATKVKAIVSLADMGYVGMNSFKGTSIKDIYFVGNAPGELGSVNYEQPDSYPFKDGQNIYVKKSKVADYKSKWQIAPHMLNITHEIPQETNKNGGTVCFPFDVKYPEGQGDKDIKPYVPVDYTYAYAVSNPIVRAYSLDDYYVPAYVGVLIRSKKTATVSSYCQMDEEQLHKEDKLTAVGYNKNADNRMVGAVEDVTITNESGFQYYAFSKKYGKFVQLKDNVTFPYFKAYFRLRKNPTSPAKGFSIVYDEEDVPAGIDGITDFGKDNDNAPYYNLNGVQVSKPTKGVYIHNGKKVIIK